MGRASSRASPWDQAANGVASHRAYELDWPASDCTDAGADGSPNMAFAPEELHRSMGKVLRLVLCAAPSPLPHHALRAKALSGGERALDKCLLDLAVLTLVEQRVLLRHGLGNWALYTVPEEVAAYAHALAFHDFPSAEEDPAGAQLISLTQRVHPARSPCGPPPTRRNPSPRQRGGGRGIGGERAPAARPRSARKRAGAGGDAADVAAALQKKMRFSFSGTGWVPPPPGGPAPMSP